MKTVAIYHIKGGVGKTASAVNLAFLASRDGFRTLLCDLDPQASATFYLRIRSPKKHSGKKLIQGGKSIAKNIRGTDFPGLDLLPSDFSYRKLDLLLSDVKGSKKKLRDILAPLAKEYDLIFLDSPPNITLASENIFRAANIILVPMIPTTLSLNTYEKLLAFIADKEPGSARIAAFFSMVERRKKMHNQTMEQLSDTDPLFLRSYIPYSALIEKMGLYRQPVPAYRPNSMPAEAYRQLWAELKALLA